MIGIACTQSGQIGGFQADSTDPLPSPSPTGTQELVAAAVPDGTALYLGAADPYTLGTGDGSCEAASTDAERIEALAAEMLSRPLHNHFYFGRLASDILAPAPKATFAA